MGHYKIQISYKFWAQKVIVFIIFIFALILVNFQILEPNFQHIFKSSKTEADVFLHNPPVSIGNVSTSALPVSIRVQRGNLWKMYNFMIGDLNTNRFCYKIASRNNYSLEIGPNVDVAFMSFCAYVLDDLFEDDNNSI